LAEEYAGTKVMFLHVHQGQAIHTVDKLVRTPADVAGMKLRIPTRTGSWVIEALGAAPTAMPVPALPQALSKKVVDGALIPWEIIPPLKLQDLTKYQIEGHNGVRFGTTTFQVTMNQNTWNSLPKDIQKAIDEVNSEAWVAEVGTIWSNSDKGGIGVAVKAGNEHVVLTEAETQAFRDAIEPVVDRWISEVGEKGIDGRKLVETARKLVAKHSK
jgi:TRAP-type C4-dicarboxylate transport system substrate-binding protein